jgi:predicted secreted protein
MAARFGLPAKGIEGFRLEGLDGRVLGNVAAVDRPDADVLALVGHELRPVDWGDVVWIDPVQRTLLLTRDGAAALTRPRPSTPEQLPARRDRRRTAGLVAAAVGVLSLLSIALQAGGSDQKTPLWALLTVAAVAFAGSTILLGLHRRLHLHRRAAANITAAVVALVASASALASAAPVGPLPKGPVSVIRAQPGSTFVVSLPKAAVAGRVWRMARPYKSSVVRGLREGETGSTVWLRFRAVSPGVTNLVFALTRGERSHAYATRTFTVTVR